MSILSNPAAETAVGKPILSIENVCKSFSSDMVVMDNFSLTMQEGECVSIIGPSGSGKSTLLRVLMGLDTIDSGLVRFEQKDYIHGVGPTRKPRLDDQLRQRIGMVFQHYTLFPHLSVLGNLMLAPTKVLKQSKKVAEERALQLLARFGLENKAHQYPSQLSGGQKQRIAIARALMLEPRLMLLDEITSALDPEMVEEVQKVIMQLAQQKMSMILVTHDMQVARSVASRVVFCANGKVVEQGRPDEMFLNPREPRTKEFLSKFLYTN
ncbi:amino acid ABC transporter ATP-binding protein [Ectopseudomonas mendocina]|uniref:Amino acid ABC transporter ATP-binding protein n=1 Tax=Ectopseudomonas mendocina TaxID=300 RepID=A0ABZ2RIV1_ECTME